MSYHRTSKKNRQTEIITLYIQITQKEFAKIVN